MSVLIILGHVLLLDLRKEAVPLMVVVTVCAHRKNFLSRSLHSRIYVIDVKPGFLGQPEK